MSWRGTLTYASPTVDLGPRPKRNERAHTLSSALARSFNKYIQIAARATRQALKEEERLKAEKRGAVTLKWQSWKDGIGGAQTWVVPPVEEVTKN